MRAHDAVAPAEPLLIHATCVAINNWAVLIQGKSGSGKSDLALRLIDRGAVLVSDDYTALTAHEGTLIASAPARIKGKIEVRGIGIIDCVSRNDVQVALIINLDQAVERLPETTAHLTFLGIALPAFAVSAFEPSAPIKVERALALVRKT
jgi:serine kinase of HPr protein (carbohydrate metabolism regulator)